VYQFINLKLYYNSEITLCFNSSIPIFSQAETKIGFIFEYFSLIYSILSEYIFSSPSISILNSIHSNQSILLKTFILFCLAHILSSISSTTLIFISSLLSEVSITCKSKSDSIESSKVDLKASISFGGNSLINQIVSFTKTSFGGIYFPVSSS
jgi:hypothetical protein